jgi:hypothetical protein
MLRVDMPNTVVLSGVAPELVISLNKTLEKKTISVENLTFKQEKQLS